jgi:hypothetical protein
MADSDDDLSRSRRLGADDRRWSNIGRILGDRTIGGSGIAVCGLYRAHGDEKRVFLS